MSWAARSGKLPGSGMWAWSSSQVQGFPFPRVNNLNIYWSAALHYLFCIILRSSCSSSRCPCPLLEWADPKMSFPSHSKPFWDGLVVLSGRFCRWAGLVEGTNTWQMWKVVPLEKFAEVIPKNINGRMSCSSQRVLCHLAPAHTKGSGQESSWSDLTFIMMNVLMHPLVK